MLDLVDLAAQAQDHRGRNVGVRQYSGQCAAKLFGVRADGVAATLAVREGHHAIHVGGQRCAIEAVRDQLGGVRRAVAGRHYGDIVARTHGPVLARIAQKSGRGAARWQRSFAGWEFVVKVQLFESQVVRVHVMAGVDIVLGAADDLAIAPHHFAPRNHGQRDLVAGRDRFARDERLAIHLQLGPGGDRHAGDSHIVGGMQMDDGVLRRRQLGDFEQHFLRHGYLMSSVSGASSPKWTCSFPPKG